MHLGHSHLKFLAKSKAPPKAPFLTDEPTGMQDAASEAPAAPRLNAPYSCSSCSLRTWLGLGLEIGFGFGLGFGLGLGLGLGFGFGSDANPSPP